MIRKCNKTNYYISVDTNLVSVDTNLVIMLS